MKDPPLMASTIILLNSLWTIFTDGATSIVQDFWIGCYSRIWALIMWVPMLIQSVWDYLFESLVDYVCRKTPEEWWEKEHMQWMECERRVYPWYHWWINTNVYYYGKWALYLYDFCYVQYWIWPIIIIGIYRFCQLSLMWERPERALWLHHLRKPTLILAWLRGKTIEGKYFRPLAPAGSEGNLTWSTDWTGLRRRDGEDDEVTQPFPALNGTYWTPLPYRFSTTRLGHELEVTATPIWWCGLKMMPDDMLTLRHVVRKENDGTLKVYVAELGTHTSSVYSAELWDTLWNTMRCSDKETQPFSVGAVINRFCPDATRAEVTTLQSFFANWWNDNLQFVQVGVQQTTPKQCLQFVGDERDDALAPWKNVGRVVGPIYTTHSDSMPAAGIQADIAAVHYRLDNCRNPVNDYDIRVFRYCTEFLNILSPEQIQPWDLDTILEHQDGPLQKVRNRIAKWSMWMYDHAVQVKAMIKKEAIANQGPVRNISIPNTDHNLNLGMYMQAAAEWLKKNTLWYCAGKTPTATAERIRELAHEARKLPNGVRYLCCADVSKMDAAKSPYLTAWFTTRLYVKLFGLEEEELVQLRINEAKTEAKTDSGLIYGAGASQLSGSACTTIDNTCTSAFISYVAYREEGLDAETAYKLLGAYVGDDSVSHNTLESIEVTGKLLGYTLTADIISEDEDIPFLSRYFYQAWTGGWASVQDPVRLMRKFHLSIAPPTVTEKQAAVDKAYGYFTLDPSCSVYRAIYSCIARVTRLVPKHRFDISYMQNLVELGGGWPTANDADDIWEKYTNMPVSYYVNWLEKVKTWEEYLEGPRKLIEVEPKEKLPQGMALDPNDVVAVVPERAERGKPPPTATVGMQTIPTEVLERGKTAEKEIKKMVKAEKTQQVKKAPNIRIKMSNWKNPPS